MIEINDLNIYYDKKQIIKDMSTNILNNGIYTLIGANGSGKTTFMKSLVLEKQIKINGDIYINSEILSQKIISKNISFMPQFLDTAFPYTALEIVMMGHKNYIHSFIKQSDIKEYALHIMEKLNILDFRNRNIQTLSGGEKSKVFLAKTLCKNTNIILLDEPDCSLDFANKINFYSLLNEIKKDKIIIMSSHDILSISFTDFIIPFYKDSNYNIILKNEINKNILKNIYPSLNTDFFNKNLHNILNLFN